MTVRHYWLSQLLLWLWNLALLCILLCSYLRIFWQYLNIRHNLFQFPIRPWRFCFKVAIKKSFVLISSLLFSNGSQYISSITVLNPVKNPWSVNQILPLIVKWNISFRDFTILLQISAGLLSLWTWLTQHFLYYFWHSFGHIHFKKMCFISNVLQYQGRISPKLDGLNPSTYFFEYHFV